MTIAESTRQFQVALEHLRAAREQDADEDTLAELSQDADRARAVMERAWLEGLPTRPEDT
ncbi:MAG: hypothetical protein ACYCQK_02030 [Acidiferrobacteraceae bacterium]